MSLHPAHSVDLPTRTRAHHFRIELVGSRRFKKGIHEWLSNRGGAKQGGLHLSTYMDIHRHTSIYIHGHTSAYIHVYVCIYTPTRIDIHVYIHHFFLHLFNVLPSFGLGVLPRWAGGPFNTGLKAAFSSLCMTAELFS